MFDFEGRRKKLRKLLSKSGAAALLVSNESNVYYLTGFTGDSTYLLLGRRHAILVSDSRYTTQLAEECPDVEAHIRPSSGELAPAVADVAKSAKFTSLSIEADHVSISLGRQLAECLAGVEVVPQSGLVESLRQIKDRHEIAETRQAVRYAQRAFAILRATLRPERTEKELADDLEHQLRLLGASGCAFPPIVAAGPRAALPHARPTNAQVGQDGLILVDWGAQARRYRSDLTRVLVRARIPPKLERVYGVVLRAQLQAIDAIRPGVRACDVDQVARKVIADAGFGKHFGHSLGHGVGLDIHEAPRLGARNQLPLQPGMVVTVEPGIYLPGWGGVRIEDDVLVTSDGHEVLSSVPKDLDEAIVV